MQTNGLPPYDEGNVFARILRGEIPAKKVAEDATSRRRRRCMCW